MPKTTVPRRVDDFKALWAAFQRMHVPPEETDEDLIVGHALRRLEYLEARDAAAAQLLRQLMPFAEASTEGPWSIGGGVADRLFQRVRKWLAEGGDV